MKKRPLDLLVVALLVLGSGLFVGLHVDGYTKLSPIDEMQHLDYLDRVPEAPALGDRVGQEAMRSQACRGVDSPGIGTYPCGPDEEYDPLTFQERGYNTAALNPPFYYAVTRVAAEAIEVVSPADDLLTGARLAGALWLGLGLVLTYGAARARGASPVAGGAVCGVLLAAPAMIYASSTVNPDSFAFLWGAVLLALLTWWERAPSLRRGVPLVVAAGLATAVKFTFLMAPAAIGAYLLFRLVSEGSSRGEQPAEDDEPAPTRLELRTGIVTSLAVVAVPLLVALAWLEFQGTRPQQDPSDPPPMSALFAVPSFPWLQLYDSALVFVTPLSSPWVVVGTLQLSNFASALVTTVLTAGVVAAAFFGFASTKDALLARSALLSAVVFGLGLVTVNYLTSSSYFPLPPRYGSTLVPFFAVVTATALRNRTGQALMAVVAVVGLIVSAWRLLGFA